jgi:hypothetical protein
MKPGKCLLAIERLLEPGPDPAHPMSYLTDMHMMVSLRGRERTPAEYTRLLTAAGFSEPTVIPTASPFYVLEASSV